MKRVPSFLDDAISAAQNRLGIVDKPLENKKKTETRPSLLELNFKQVAQPLRLSLSGQANGPSVSSILFILGKNEVLERINKVW